MIINMMNLLFVSDDFCLSVVVVDGAAADDDDEYVV